VSARKSMIVCPKCRREVAVIGTGRARKLARHNTPSPRGWSLRLSSERCEGSSALAEPILLALLEREVEHAKQCEAKAEARLKEAEIALAVERARIARIAKRIEELRAKEIEIGARIAQLEASAEAK
jgi:hypothetical protein